MKMLISLIQLTMEEVSELFDSIHHDMMVNQDVGMPKVSSGSNILIKTEQVMDIKLHSWHKLKQRTARIM